MVDTLFRRSYVATHMAFKKLPTDERKDVDLPRVRVSRKGRKAIYERYRESMLVDETFTAWIRRKLMS